MTDRYGYPTIIEQKQRGVHPFHDWNVYTNCATVLTGRRQLLGSAQSLTPSSEIPQTSYRGAKSVRPRSTYRAARRNERRVVRARQLEEKRNVRG